MATYYYVGGTGTWDTTTKTNWALTSGGTGGFVGPPTSTDNVIIDTSSGTGTITCTAGVCADLTVTATQAIILGASASSLSVFGNLTFPATGSFSANTNSWGITFASTTTGKTITTNGKAFSAVTFNGVGGGWTLGSALTVAGAFILTNGTLDTSAVGNYSITGSFSSLTLGVGTKTFNLNASTIGFSSVNFLTNATGFTLNVGTSTISLTGTFQPNTYTYYNVTFFSQTVDGLRNIVLTTNLNVSNILSLGASNTAVRRVFVASDVIGTQRTITATTVAAINDVDFRDIAFSASQTGTRLGDCGGNSNITFPAAKTVYWAITTGVSWASTTTATWATGSSSGTANVNNIPLAQDTAIIDTKPNSGQNITMNQAWNFGTLDMSARTTALTFTWGAAPNVYGNWINGTGLTYSGTNTLNFVGRTTQQLTSAGVAFTNPITIAGTTACTVQLQDAFTTASTQTVTLTTGTFDANNYNVSTGLFAYSGTGTKAILMGSGIWTLTGTGTVWNTNATGTTFTRATSQINTSSASTKTFAGAGLTYYNLTNTGSGALTISGNNTYNNLSALAGCPITFTSGSTQSANSFTFVGTPSAPITIAPSSTTNYTLTKLGGGTVNMSYVSISRCTATPNTLTWYATNSTDGGNNTGIIFQFTATVNETGSLADTQSELLSAPTTITELGNATDLESASMVAPTTINELGNALDSESLSMSSLNTINELGNALDSESTLMTAPTTINEFGNATDAISEIMSATANINETGNANDTQSENSYDAVTINESGNAQDTQLQLIQFNTNINEIGNAQDLQSLNLTAYLILTESANAQDTQSALFLALLTIIESGNASDLVTAQLIAQLNQHESANLIDNIIAGMSAPVSIAEIANSLDIESVLVSVSKQITEQAQASDLLSEKTYLILTIIENGNAVDVYYCTPIFNSSEKVWHLLPRATNWNLEKRLDNWDVLPRSDKWNVQERKDNWEASPRLDYWNVNE